MERLTTAHGEAPLYASATAARSNSHSRRKEVVGAPTRLASRVKLYPHGKCRSRLRREAPRWRLANRGESGAELLTGLPLESDLEIDAEIGTSRARLSAGAVSVKGKSWSLATLKLSAEDPRTPPRGSIKSEEATFGEQLAFERPIASPPWTSISVRC
jgi:hypothetical protein